MIFQQKCRFNQDEDIKYFFEYDEPSHQGRNIDEILVYKLQLQSEGRMSEVLKEPVEKIRERIKVQKKLKRKQKERHKDAKKKSLELRSQIQSNLRSKFPQFFPEGNGDQNSELDQKQKEEEERRIEHRMNVDVEWNIQQKQKSLKGYVSEVIDPTSQSSRYKEKERVFIFEERDSHVKRPSILDKQKKGKIKRKMDFSDSLFSKNKLLE